MWWRLALLFLDYWLWRIHILPIVNDKKMRVQMDKLADFYCLSGIKLDIYPRKNFSDRYFINGDFVLVYPEDDKLHIELHNIISKNIFGWLIDLEIEKIQIVKYLIIRQINFLARNINGNRKTEIEQIIKTKLADLSGCVLDEIPIIKIKGFDYDKEAGSIAQVYEISPKDGSVTNIIELWNWGKIEDIDNNIIDQMVERIFDLFY